MEPRVVRSSAAVWRQAPHVLVVSVPPGPVWQIDGSAPVVWEALARPTTLAGLIDTVGRAVGVPGQSVAADVTRLVDELRDRGLVVEAST